MWKSRPSRREMLAYAASAPALLALRGARPRARDLAELAESYRRCARADVLDQVAEDIHGGADFQTVMGAIFLAGVLDIRPRHVGGKLHAVLEVASVFQLAELTDKKTAWQLALWNLDDFKRSQELDRQEGEWELPPRPEVSFASEDAARAEFLAAMEAWDDERADRALVGLLPYYDQAHASLLEILWPLAARSFVNIGHKIIFAAQVERVLERIGWQHAEPALRSLVYGLLHRPSGTEMEAYERSTELAPHLPESWRAGKEDPERSRELLHELRERDSKTAQELVVAAFRDGLGPATVWDGLRLFAAELFLRRLASQPADDRRALLPVHAVTVTNAFGHVWRTTKSEATQRLLILQAAGWLPLLKDALNGIVGLASDGPKIDALGNDEKSATLDELLASPTPAAVRGVLESDSQRSLYETRLITGLAHQGIEHHQHKYAAAVFEERRLVHRRWSSHLLACALPYLGAASVPETEICQRSLHALEKAGIH